MTAARQVPWVRLLLCLAAIFTSSVSGAVEKKEVDGITYHVLRALPDQVRLLWKDDKGEVLSTLPAAKAHLAKQDLKAAYLMNGGIYEPGGIPSGLYIEEGKTHRPVNRRQGKGNFYLKPNGILLIGSDKARVIPTQQYPLTGFKAQYAVQSGPLLLYKGKPHPVFKPDSKSRLHRNGVGVDAQGNLVFAITDFDSKKFPTLYDFSMLFKSLGCKEALFLDGDISQLRSADQLDRHSNRFGSIIAILPSTH